MKIGTKTVSKKLFGSREISKEVLNGSVVYENAPSAYEIGFRGMVGSQTSLTRTGEAIGATWTDSSGVISINGIDISKIWGGYVGNDGETLTWDPATLKYMNGSSVYTGNVFTKLNRFFIKPYYENSKLDGYDLYFGKKAPSAEYEDWFLGKDHCIIGCYKARNDGHLSGGLQSKQALTHMVGCTPNNTVIAYKLNSSTAYSLHEKWYNENAILQVLFMVIFATKRTEDVFPRETFRSYNSDTRATGYMDSYRASSLFAYEPTGDSGKRGNMFLGIEDFVGWGFELVAGVVLNDTSVCPTTDYANFNYSNTYTADLTLSSTNGWITELQESTTNPGLLVPKTTGGRETTYFCDWQSIDSNCWYQGAAVPNDYGGVFCFIQAGSGSGAARLCGIPL